MPRAKVSLEHPAIGALLKSAGLRGDVNRRGAAVLAAAIANAPVGETGNYKAGLAATDDTTDRAVCRVGSDVPYAGVVEARTGNIVRALDAAG